MVSTQALSNLDSVGVLIGNYLGMAQGINEDAYIGSLIKDAHSTASNAFDETIASVARTGRMQHVYEFGTAGITPGALKFPDPTAPEARLWIHTLEGKGGNQDVGYKFRPALNRNPQPTTASTGVPSNVLRRLSRRKYVFWNKAFVMETGMQVTIKSKQPHGMLFVPFYGHSGDDPKNNRGYMMWNFKRHGPISLTPGVNTKGRFTAFWLNWWSSAGGSIMEESMRKKVTEHTRLAHEEAARLAKAERMKPAAAINIFSTTGKSAARAKKSYRRRSR